MPLPIYMDVHIPLAITDGLRRRKIDEFIATPLRLCVKSFRQRVGCALDAVAAQLPAESLGFSVLSESRGFGINNGREHASAYERGAAATGPRQRP